jgi:hypothetical protein
MEAVLLGALIALCSPWSEDVGKAVLLATSLALQVASCAGEWTRLRAPSTFSKRAQNRQGSLTVARAPFPSAGIADRGASTVSKRAQIGEDC